MASTSSRSRRLAPEPPATATTVFLLPAITTTVSVPITAPAIRITRYWLLDDSGRAAAAARCTEQCIGTQRRQWFGDGYLGRCVDERVELRSAAGKVGCQTFGMDRSDDRGVRAGDVTSLSDQTGNGTFRYSVRPSITAGIRGGGPAPVTSQALRPEVRAGNSLYASRAAVLARPAEI